MLLQSHEDAKAELDRTEVDKVASSKLKAKHCKAKHMTCFLAATKIKQILQLIV